jgi:uncharacterized protein
VRVVKLSADIQYCIAMPEGVRKSKTLLLIVIAASCMSGCTRTHKEGNLANLADRERIIATLREAYAAFNRGDIDAAVQGLDANIEWTEPPEFPGGGSYHGREGAKRYLTQSRAAWAEVISEPERFIPAGDRMIVFVYARVRPRDSQDWQEVRLADVYSVRDGKIVAMHAFADREAAQRWAGQ